MRIIHFIKNYKIKILMIFLFLLLIIFLFLDLNDHLFNKYKYISSIEMMKMINNGKIEKISLIETGNKISGENRYKIEAQTYNNEFFYTKIPSILYTNFYSQIQNNKIPFNNKEKLNFLKLSLNALHPVYQIAFLFFVIPSRMSLNKVKSYSKTSSKQKSQFSFKDVAGNEEEKEEMKELIDFLKNPKKYQKIGASIPKGVLLEGPPGTGKTLLAKAVAGEANVPFYSVSGSEFDGILIGLGSKKIKKLFANLKHNAPCILFIDEIDSLGKKRGNIDNKHEQTLNQLLTEMDGFLNNEGIIIIGATNRLDVLDSALLRPGRFDRIIKVSLPDVKGREAILKVHARNKKLDQNVNLGKIAKQTTGMSGAQLGAVLNEASILTIRNQKDIITMTELEEAIDRVLMGPAKISIKYTEEERKMVAYHEAGHAVIGLKLKNAFKVQKITIIPRGDAGGYNLMLPPEETFFSSKKRMLANIISLLGGRVAEEIIFDDISSGAYNDFKEATRIVEMMVTKYGMSELGLLQNSKYSDHKMIDIEMKKIINQCYEKTKKIIKENKMLLDKIVRELLQKETINEEQIYELI